MTHVTLSRPNIFDIATELRSVDPQKAHRLAIQTKNIGNISETVLAKEKLKLEEVERTKVAPLTQKVLDHMLQKHLEFNEMLSEKLDQGKITREGYIRYLIQAWYHTRYTPDFEALFGQKLASYLRDSSGTKFERGNKFIMLVESEVDEEAGHELWALQDLQTLGVTEFNLATDVFEQSKALIATQFDRIHRLNFMGFLGYSFYLEFWVAKYAAFQLELLTSQGIPQEAQTFLHNHYVVDQGHACDNIELLNFLIDSEEVVQEVIENMNIIHLLYSSMVARSFS